MSIEYQLGEGDLPGNSPALANYSHADLYNADAII